MKKFIWIARDEDGDYVICRRKMKLNSSRTEFHIPNEEYSPEDYIIERDERRFRDIFGFELCDLEQTKVVIEKL
jgi:hypothetical protein